MAINYNSVVPWGRNKGEYQKMFDLSEEDLGKKIISFGDGPASFNAEMYEAGAKVVSIDPVYQLLQSQIRTRIAETRDEVIEQVKANMDLFVWKEFKNLNDLVEKRMGAMNRFLNDFETGKEQGRYIVDELPERTNFNNHEFDIGLSSHFLLLYSNLSLEFHIESISEMLRICKEVRIFPVIDLNAKKSIHLDKVIKHFNKKYSVELQIVDYEFQIGGNEMLLITNN